MLPVGYLPCTQDPPAGKNMARVIDEIVAEARAAEASGWDGCFITEHHQQEDGYLPNPLLTAGLIGMKTRRIKVGTCVLLLPLYHPVRVAEDCAIVDQATRGRLVLSIGVGYQQPDFDAFEVPIESRARRTEEALAILRQSWHGGRFSFEGSHFKLMNVLGYAAALSGERSAGLDGLVDAARTSARGPNRRRMDRRPRSVASRD